MLKVRAHIVNCDIKFYVFPIYKMYINNNTTYDKQKNKSISKLELIWKRAETCTMKIFKVRKCINDYY